MGARDTITPGWFSLEGASVYTGFSITSIRKAMEAGAFEVRSVTITGSGTKDNARIKREHLDAWIESCPLKYPVSPHTAIVTGEPKVAVAVEVPPPPPGLMNATDVGKTLGVSSQQVVRWYQLGIIPASVKTGRLYRFDLESVRRALAAHAEGPS